MAARLPFVRAALPAGRRQAASRGLTLIELMIVVVIVSILAAVALPSYRAHVRKSTRAEAQAYMLAVAGRQQQFLTDTRGFATLSGVGVTVPANVSTSYTVAMPDPSGTPPTFTLTLTPRGDQASEPCGTLSINQAGAKTAATAGCW